MRTENKKQLYEFTKDDSLSGKKKGDKVHLTRVTERLQEIVRPVGDSDDSEEVPTDKWTKEEIIQWLSSKGITEPSGTKEELLKLVKKVSK